MINGRLLSLYGLLQNRWRGLGVLFVMVDGCLG
jgi:hypothetical protein